VLLPQLLVGGIDLFQLILHVVQLALDFRTLDVEILAVLQLPPPFCSAFVDGALHLRQKLLQSATGGTELTHADVVLL
jgi:hypothetical protein